MPWYRIRPDYLQHPSWDESWFFQRIYWRAYDHVRDFYHLPFFVVANLYIQDRRNDAWNFLTNPKTWFLAVMLLCVWLFAWEGFDPCRDAGRCRNEDEWLRHHPRVNPEGWFGVKHHRWQNQREWIDRDEIVVGREVARDVPSGLTTSTTTQQPSLPISSLDKSSSPALEGPQPSTSSPSLDSAMPSARAITSTVTVTSWHAPHKPTERPPGTCWTVPNSQKINHTFEAAARGDPRDRTSKYCIRCRQWHCCGTHARARSWALWGEEGPLSRF